jgi:hypothetical protein
MNFGLPSVRSFFITVWVMASLFGDAAWAIDNAEVASVRDTWLDPKDPLLAPRSGARLELAPYLGVEGSFSGFQPNKLPTIGGASLTIVGRYYPVDRLAVTFGARTYFGLDGIPASGTTTTSVMSTLAGIRYDLVRERRFSLVCDLYSGPSMFAIADIIDLSSTTRLVTAIGIEMGGALVVRYSFGPAVFEVRGLAGGRVGRPGVNPNASDVSSSPFSAVYIGGDVGVSLISMPVGPPPKLYPSAL